MVNKALTAKGIIIVILLLIGFLLGRESVPETITEYWADGERWCFYAKYTSMDSYEAVRPPESSFISFKGDTVRVFAKCKTNYETNI